MLVSCIFALFLLSFNDMSFYSESLSPTQTGSLTKTPPQEV